MQIQLIDRSGWVELFGNPAALVKYIEKDYIFIIRRFMSNREVDKFKRFCIEFGNKYDPSWHPCLDGCPDYHRIHHNYPKAYVPSIQHGYYFHPWNEHFGRLVNLPSFREIFELKRETGGLNDNAYLTNLPSEGPIARIVCHQYPKGGGGQAEHIDPVSPFAKIQTLIQASEPGVDYRTGGLYVNHSRFGVVNVDPLTHKGDLILVSPGIKHGVAAVDPGEKLRWDDTSGRWIIMPIIIHSDHIKDPTIRPVKMGTA